MDAEPVVYPYLEEVNQSVLRVVTPSAGAGPGPTVLDVGCGYGALARELSARGLRVWGIERDPKATAVALERMERVIVADFTDGAELAKELGDARFDVIMFSDVLEHTVDPPGVLSGFLDYLSDDGRIVVSVPNVANWVTRFGLLFGRFTYTATGVLDRTHLRFFTRRSAIELVRACGLEVRTVDFTPMLVRAALPLVKKRVIGDQTSTDVQVISDSRLYRLYARLVLPLERAIVRIAPGLLAFQVVIVAARPSEGQ
jgi:2-polyprenyl-3-methyl-5-hydroxy-6-metoxy-1,4-benzoquinol methylase